MMKRDISSMTIDLGDSLMDAMRAIDLGAAGIALVVDSKTCELSGVLTDGDVRRAILGGGSLDSVAAQYMTTDFWRTGPEEGRNQVIDLMRAHGVHQIPIVEDGRVVGLHTLDDLVGTFDRANPAVLMAGGRGSRLQPITDETPKPMVQVAGRPILERLVLHLVGWGIKTIYVSVNYLGDLIEEHFGDGSKYGCQIEYLREDEPLGTGGSLSLLPELTHPAIVMNGDLLTQVDIGALLRTHETGGFVATMGVRAHRVELPFGVVETAEGRMRGFVEKPTNEHLVNAGIYVMNPEVIGAVPSDTFMPITEIFESALAHGDPIGVHLVTEDWIDVGNPTDLRKAKGQL